MSCNKHSIWFEFVAEKQFCEMCSRINLYATFAGEIMGLVHSHWLWLVYGNNKYMNNKIIFLWLPCKGIYMIMVCPCRCHLCPEATESPFNLKKKQNKKTNNWCADCKTGYDDSTQDYSFALPRKCPVNTKYSIRNIVVEYNMIWGIIRQ